MGWGPWSPSRRDADLFMLAVAIGQVTPMGRLAGPDADADGLTDIALSDPTGVGNHD